MNTTSTSTSVFISHSSADRAIAKAACESLEAAGIKCWIAPRDVGGGKFYASEIVQAIRRASVFVLIFSEAADASEQVLQEVERATHLKIPILAIRLGAVTPSDSFAYFLGVRHWVEPSIGINRAVDFSALPQQVAALLPQAEDKCARLRLAVDELGSARNQYAETVSKGKPKKKHVRWLEGTGVCCAIALIAWFFSGRSGLFNQGASQAASTERSIAVLPFESLSESKSDTYFADGVQDEILNNLAKISQLKVISRTSVMKYRASTERDLRQIADALGVANVLEGTVRRNGNHVRVSIKLVDARNDNTIWADSYDRDLTDIFTIQSEIAQRVASKLSAELSPEEEKEIAEKPTDNLDAYDLYLQATELVTNATVFYFKDPRENLLMAIRFLENATRIDSHYALAYCLLAKAHDSLYAGGFDKTLERRALGDAAVNEALRLRPDLPEAHLAMAFHRLACYRDYETARVQVAIAQQFLPNSSDALAIAADIDRRQGRWAESTAGLQKALALDPRNPELLSELANNYFWLRRYRDYRNTYDRLIELLPDKPILILQKAFSAIDGYADLTSYGAALKNLSSSMRDDITFGSSRFAYALAARDWITAKEILSTHSELFYFNADTSIPRGALEIWLTYVQGGQPATEPRFADAREELKRKLEAHPEDASLLSTLAVIDAALGRKQQAIEEAKHAVVMLPVSKDAVDGPPLVYNLAAVFAAIDEPGLAFQELTTSIKTPGGASYGTLKLDPAWDPLRKDPRFDKLLAELAPQD